MRRTINGTVFETDKATEIASYWNNLSCSDFRYVAETLYRTAKGAFFLHGEGGALSSYQQSSGDGWSGGSRIKPMTEPEAFEWCQDRNCQTAIDAHFGHLLVEA
jgi:hypothetical protein